ncbi:MAG: diaminobutyrate--2-oxoglutarate transaminase [Rhizobiaceae bacterium]
MLDKVTSEKTNSWSTNELHVFERLESDVQSYARNFPAVFSRAVGAEIWDVNGNRYLDFLAGAGSLNYGHNHPAMKAALVDYILDDQIGNSLDLHTDAKQKFLVALDDIVLKPRDLDYVVQFTGPTGTNAVEAALKVARKVTGRTNVVAFTNGFHGVTSAALAATGNSGHRGGSGMPLTGVSRMPYEGYLGPDVDTIDYLEKMITDPSSGLDLPAAVLVETVQGEGGHRAASANWLRRLETVCRDHDILLIVDEIQAGCGRTGTFFSFEPSGIKPDIVTLSKSISGFGLPLALVLIRPDLDIWKPGEHNGTFRGNNHAFVTATSALETYWKTRTFEKQLKAKSAVVAERLSSMQDRHSTQIISVPGRGMMRGLEFADPNEAGKVAKLAFEKGLIAERVGPRDEVVKCMTPINIDNAHLNEGLDILEQSIGETLGSKKCANYSVKSIRPNA